MTLCEFSDAPKAFCHLVEVADNILSLTYGLHNSIISY